MDDTATSLGVAELTRTFGSLRAVDAVSFEVPGGAMTGFVGGNGAGKTTTMRMMMGVLAPDSGQVFFGGAPITVAQRRRIGYMPEQRGLYAKQKVIDQLVYLGRLKGVTQASATASAHWYLERFGLAERNKERLEKLSLGNQQRVQIIAALMNEPAALILDEPFSGLDPLAVDDMADLLRQQAARGIPVLFSSHQLELVERLCDHLVILAGGQVRAAGTVNDLRDQPPPRWRLVARQDVAWIHDLAARTPALHVLETEGKSAVYGVDAATTPQKQEQLADEVLDQAMRRGGLDEFTRLRPSVAEIYREVSA